MKASTLLVFIGLLSVSSLALSWEQTGHRITGALAEFYLTDAARARIRQLLPNETLAEASTYADEMRSNPSVFWQEAAPHWHYVTIPQGKSYGQIGAPVVGDAITALKAFRVTLQDDQAALVDQQIALRFIVHLIGDLHQPLHAGNGLDRGGNQVKVKFFGNPSNLHRVWDSGLIHRRGLSYTEWVDMLKAKITPGEVLQWAETDPLIWIAESAKIRDTIYPGDSDLAWDYVYYNLPTVKRRLQQAGVRMAAYLNEVFGG